MNTFFKGVSRLVLAITLSVCSLTASAQNVAASGAFVSATLKDIAFVPTPQYCVAPGTTVSTPITFTFTLPSGVTAAEVSWRVAGDFTLVSGFAQGVTGTSFQVRPTGFGKMRVTVNYYTVANVTGTVTCSGVSQTCTYPQRTTAARSFDFYKSFIQSGNYTIKGPTCLPVSNPSVVYAVDPALLSSLNQISTGIGVDTYDWVVTRAASPFAAVPFVASGDGSQIIIDGADLPGGSFNVKVRVGRCNSYSTSVLVKVAANLFAGSAITGFPTCRAIDADGLSATFTLNSTTGVDYTLSATGGLSVSPSTISAATASGAQTITLSGITATNTGSVVITGVGAGGTCFGTQTTILTMNRVLSSANSITPICVAPSTANTVLTLVSAPVGQSVTYGVTGTG